MSGKILVVDDEAMFREGVALYMRMEGFDVAEAKNGLQAIDLCQDYRPDLVVLDVMLPDINGMQVCESIREHSDVPIIFLTALGDDDYQLMGYRVGADDYVTKPFKGSILAAKIRRMLKKTNNSGRTQIYSFTDISLDTQRYICKAGGTEIFLTQKEYALLLEFMQNPGRVLTRSYLLDIIWDNECDVGSRVVDNTVTRLRKKLANTQAEIKTVISVGYKMEERVASL